MSISNALEVTPYFHQSNCLFIQDLSFYLLFNSYWFDVNFHKNLNLEVFVCTDVIIILGSPLNQHHQWINRLFQRGYIQFHLHKWNEYILEPFNRYTSIIILVYTLNELKSLENLLFMRKEIPNNKHFFLFLNI